jgi:hypothetical protein
MLDRSTKSGSELAAGGVLFLAAILYLAAFPRDLGFADESFFLYESARLRNGERMYRDIFQFITPLSAYAMAFLYWCFGTTIATARLGTAALHATTVVLLYATCRRLEVRRPIAAVAAIGYLAISQPAWPFASWHWYSTMLTTLLLLVTLTAPWATRPAWAIAPGLATGLLIGVQQQKGAVLAVAMCLLFAIDHAVDRRYGSPAGWRPLLRRLCFFAAGVALIVAPLLAHSIAIAGFMPVFDALVRWPLETYRPNFQIRWGRLSYLAVSFGRNTFPTLLRYVPLVTLPLLLRTAVGLVRRDDRARLRLHLALLTTVGASALSISYYPDVIHIAFIAPVFLVCAAEASEWALRQLSRLHLGAPAVGRTLAAIATVALAVGMAGNLRTARAKFPYTGDTAFGRVAFAASWQPLFFDYVRERLRAAGTNELFSYPNLSSPYLLCGADNPTPYQYFIATTSPREQTEEVLAILRARDLPYIIGAPIFMRDDDPVVAFIKERYDQIDVPAIEATGQKPTIWLYRRKNLDENARE